MDQVSNCDILDEIMEEWYHTDTDMSLQEYLGLSKEEFFEYLTTRENR